MSVTCVWYRQGLQAMLGSGNWLSDTIKVALHTSSYSIDQDSTTGWTTGNEVGNSGTYASGGATLASPAILISTSKVGGLDCTDVSWTSATITAAYAVVYDDTLTANANGTSPAKPIICVVNFGGNVTCTNGTFAITWDAAGVCKVTAS
jgi:hypothetical protein